MPFSKSATGTAICLIALIEASTGDLFRNCTDGGTKRKKE